MTVCYWCGAKDTIADVGKELDDGKYKMVQCKKCKTAYYVLNKEKANKQKTMTNEEWLRSCTTEQLAEWIVHIADQCTISHEFNMYGLWCDEKQVMEWLKQPHREEIHE